MSRIAVVGLVAVHLVVSLWHGDAHTTLAIDMPAYKDLFIYVVIVFAPLVAAGLVWTRHARIGLWVFALSMVGSLLFGVYHHYVLVSPDNVAHLPAGPEEAHSHFASSAAAIAVIELAAAVYGAFLLARVSRDPQVSP